VLSITPLSTPKKQTKHALHQQLNSFLESGKSLDDFFEPPQKLFNPLLKTAAEYIREER